ncbi:MAG: PHP domain-containing protein [Candidatus Thorarchaeota archaeon]|nr:PHP domain-containing protein [Candidatus Thorarchaeota archaeon]
MTLSAFDLHSHTIHSKDGLTHPRSLFKWMRLRGLRGMAVTEHERPSLVKPIVRDDRFLINACEFKTEDFGELIGLFVTEPIPPSTFEETADRIHSQGAITVLPHPRDPLRKEAALRKGLPDELISRHVDLVEGINSRCVLNIFNTWAQRLAVRLAKPVTAGSDAHSFLEIGHAKTFLADISCVEDIRRELKAGRTRIWGYPSFPMWQVPTILWQRIRKMVR